MLRNPHALIEGVDHDELRDRRHLGVHLHPRRVPHRVRGADDGAGAGPRARLRRPQTCWARATTPPSSCTAAPAPTSAARRPRCCPRSRASADSPARKPPFPAVAGLYAAPTLVNNVETLASVPYILEMGGDGLRRDRHRALEGHARVLAVGQRQAAGQLRAAADRHPARPDRGPRRRRAGRPHDEGDHPRRLVRPDPDARPDRHPHRLRVDRGRRLDGRLRRGHRDRRPHLHGAAGAARRRVLQARELRQVHALPRGHALGRGHHPPHRDGRGPPGRARPAAERVRPHPRQLPVPAGRRDGDAGGELRHPLPRRVPAPHRRGRLPVHGAQPDLGAYYHEPAVVSG